MKCRASIKSHPVHPMLVTYPFAFLTGGWGFGMAGAIWRRDEWKTVSRYMVPTGVAAGLHTYLRLPTACDEAGLVEAARRRGVLVEGASWNWSAPSEAPPALVIGYGAIAEPAICDGLAILGSLAARLR